MSHDIGPLRVGIAGITGWIGRPLAAAVDDQPDLTLATGVARSAAGTDLGELLAGSLRGQSVYATVDDALAATDLDVLVDFTSPTAVLGHALSAVAAGCAVIIGTSGLTTAELDRVDKAARDHRVGAFAAGNFSVLVAALEHAALLAAQLADSWEVIDYAGSDKPDAPSGTARQVAERLAEFPRRADTHPTSDTIGDAAARGAAIGDVPVHSVRVPGYTLSTEILFGMPGERLSLRHDADPSPQPYLQGILLATRRVVAWQGLVRGLDRLLFAPAPELGR